MRILILGANGMFGRMVTAVLSKNKGHEIFQVHRPHQLSQVGQVTGNISFLDVLDEARLLKTLVRISPDVVINCTGLIKQRPEAQNPLKIYPINALFPHALVDLCRLLEVRVIQFSTDCIFSGKKGNYADDEKSDVTDNYGLSKFIGESATSGNSLTLRTSIIGHEEGSKYQLVDWFLSQKGSITGYTNAIFSGFPTFEVGRILDRFVLPNTSLNGLYNISTTAISKYDLLHIVKDVYKKDIEIVADDNVKIDRSLNSDRFRKTTGYCPPPWQELIQEMHDLHVKS